MSSSFCFIIPVFNRPHEIEELLESFRTQDTPLPSYRIIIIEDGSTEPCKTVVERFAELPLVYATQQNTGPAQARNHGAQLAHDFGADYLIFLDSDTVLPSSYCKHLLASDTAPNALPDLFGGPDSAHVSFTPMQHAINYAMTSFLTTGGIRGGKKRMDVFYPRSFNMGVRADAFRAVEGFSAMRFGEDVDFSMRILHAGYRSALLPDLVVWHKRRASFRQFFKQVHNSGMARVLLSIKHPGSFKIVHALPALFTIFCGMTGIFGVLSLLMGNVSSALMIVLPLVLFAQLLIADAVRTTGSLSIAWKAVQASFVQLLGYGSGFLRGVWHYRLRGNTDFTAFKHTFYK